MMIKLNGYIFYLKTMTYCKNAILFGIKQALILKKEFNSRPVYNNNFLKIKIKSNGDEATDFHDKQIPQAGSDCTCLAIITIDSSLKK